jgi:hypothetical protein
MTAKRLVMEVSCLSDGRLEGTIRTDEDGPPTVFSGTLELLKALEDTLADHQSSTG